MQSLDWIRYVKVAQVKAARQSDGAFKLEQPELGVAWMLSPRSLELSYDVPANTQGDEALLLKPKKSVVWAAKLDKDLQVGSAGKEFRAAAGDYLVAWDKSGSDCWTLSAEVFESRYQKEADDKGKEEETTAKDAAASEPSVNVAAGATSTSTAASGEVTFGAASLQGKRAENEDAHVAESNWNDQFALFAVFDGHGGSDASSYCQTKLPVLLKENWNADDIETSLKDTFVATDRKYMKKGNDDGTTALVAVIDTKSGSIWVANAGDSRAVLIKAADGSVVEMSSDHKPSVPEEKKRIEAATFEIKIETIVQHGKRVKVARVDGKLAVSRAIGDDTFKDTDDEPSTWAVTSVPDVRKAELQKGDVLVMACDGLWDVCANADVAKFVLEKIGSHDDLDKLAEELANYAIGKGSDDNVSVVIAKF